MSESVTRRRVRLSRSGGSRSAVLPAAWLRELAIDEEVQMEQTPAGILITRPRREEPSIEDEPEFAAFLQWVAKDAVARPEALGDVDELMAEDEELYAGVQPDEG